MSAEKVSGSTFTTGIVLVALVFVVTSAHFLLDRSSHLLHIFHIVLAGFYLIPIIGGAVWRGLRGSIALALVSSISYFLHIRFSWANQPMENANQYGWIAVFWILAIVAGLLVDVERAEREKRLWAERNSERETVIESIAGLSNALRARDEYTREHSEHVSRLAVELARRLKLSNERVELVRLAALVHDIGKIGIRDDVLLKPHELSPKERADIERHPVVAAEILRPIRGAREIADIVIAHHECPDGSGYPNHLRGAQISTEAHIVRVADIFASLTEERPYKAAMTSRSALDLMEGFAASKLEPHIFSTFKELLASEPGGTSDRPPQSVPETANK